jgi:hypothetical protein
MLARYAQQNLPFYWLGTGCAEIAQAELEKGMNGKKKYGRGEVNLCTPQIGGESFWKK